MWLDLLTFWEAMLPYFDTFSFAVVAILAAPSDNKLQPCKSMWEWCVIKCRQEPRASACALHTYASQRRNGGIENLLRLAFWNWISLVAESGIFASLAWWNIAKGREYRMSNHFLCTHLQCGTNQVSLYLLWTTVVLLLQAIEEILFLISKFLAIEILIATAIIVLVSSTSTAHILIALATA